MTFICYAQNFEDIALWRIFRLVVEKGFYIDVGANDPTIDSVTKAFYDRGWRGMNIEPSPSFYERLCAERPRDINLQVAVSDREDQLTFFDAGEGLSTVDQHVAADLKRNGRQVVERTVPSQTLSSICARYVDGEIHFLKIDVEGHESFVLRGMDFERWRPWVLLIESPFNIEPEWLPLLKSARYHEVRHDGINRFFLAEEHMAFKGAFDMPPSYLDGFQLCLGHHFSYPIAELQSQVACERERADAAEAQLVALISDPWLRLKRLSKLRKKILGKIASRDT
ncbi:MAG: FkbM family methyltransferase [Gammaproteobacteria bacterium]|nr:FkbM family methyltransferase [Gammaproteobacteria bacterium]